MIIHILVIMIQWVGILVPFAGFIALFRKARSRTAMYLLLSNLACLIINVSYALLLRTRTREGAIVAQKMEYFGNTVFLLTFSLFLWSYLELKRYKWINLLLIIYWAVQDIVFLCAVWNEEMFHLVFKSIQFEWNETFGLATIQSEPGILYIICCVSICITVLFCASYTIWRMFHVQIASERLNLARLVGVQFVVFTSIILMLLSDFRFDIFPICATLSILFIIIRVQQNEFFGITERGYEWVSEQMEDAYVLVDEMYGYLDSNAYAKKVFPELNSKWKNETVSGELYGIFTNSEKIIHIQGRYYNKKITELKEKDKIYGYSLLLVDNTEQYELMNRVREEKERADAANQAKSAFVSNVSHEIRTPMNAIVGMTQIMLRRDLPKQEHEYLLNIQNSGNALLTIINDLLDMSKIESGKMELVDEEYDFMSILSDLGMIILNRIGNKPVELLFDIDPDIPAKLYGDALRIRQIIINLMNNATKFTEEGYVCLKVSVQQIEQDDMELLISVRDTGQGIREEDISKLFGSFQQVDARKNHHKEGTGLGLSISKQLVELMHGSIGVTSEYGEGSEFYFTIHQKIIDGTKAARISDAKQAVVAGNMKNPAANEMLKALVEQYHLTYAADIMSPMEPEMPVFYFTDRYGTLSEEEKQRLTVLDAVVYGVQNPMAENDLPEDMLTVNKPLYSYPFCNVIENRENIDGNGQISLEEADVQDTKEDETEFLAPDAHVLIVDDNEINRMIAQEMLEPLGMQIETAADGKQAVEMIQKKRYDLVLMDHQMPVMDGVEAVKKIRELNGEYYKQLPVIALTANTAKEQQEEYMRAGMSDYLSKPIYMTEICRKIRKWIPDKIHNSH